MVSQHPDERERPRPDFFPEDLSDSDVHDLEFTIAISPRNREESRQAPMLDALASAREDK
ncbi:MAG: hypothetical protein ABEK50_06760 [bacterium]